MNKSETKNKCRAGKFTTNAVVTHGALICHGGFGQPACKYIDYCKKENGVRKRKKKKNVFKLMANS